MRKSLAYFKNTIFSTYTKYVGDCDGEFLQSYSSCICCNTTHCLIQNVYTLVLEILGNDLEWRLQRHADTCSYALGECQHTCGMVLGSSLHSRRLAIVCCLSTAQTPPLCSMPPQYTAIDVVMVFVWYTQGCAGRHTRLCRKAHHGLYSQYIQHLYKVCR